MKHYAVQHKRSKLFLPPHPKSSGGATHLELSETPRIFTRAQDAVAAARWWAKGKSSFHTEQDHQGEWDTWIQTTPIGGRNLDDLKVVRIHFFCRTYKFIQEVQHEKQD